MARRVPDPAQTHVNAHRPLKYHHAVFETVAKARYCGIIDLWTVLKNYFWKYQILLKPNAHHVQPDIAVAADC